MSETNLTVEQLSAGALAYSAAATLLASGTPAHVVLEICRENAEYMVHVANRLKKERPPKDKTSDQAFADSEICGPHCDSRVLHAPGECKTCDKFPVLQRAREVWGISYTGKPEEGKIMCPGETARGMESLNSWRGNRKG